MTALDHARTAYARPQSPGRSPRTLEYDLLARVTRRMEASWSRHKKDFPGLAAALDENARLWTTFAADVAAPGNALPAPLRAQIFYLFQFTQAHTRRVLAGAASVEALVEINLSVMRGLRGETGRVDGGAAE
ncbi:MAG: flagellar biosynthesis regulator FlaF [Gemmobacter sp.]